jgi:hypothetical protein
LTFKFGSTFLQRKSQRHQDKNLNGGTVVELSARDSKTEGSNLSTAPGERKGQKERIRSTTNINVSFL